MGLSGSGINEENHIVNGSWIAWIIDDSIGAIFSVPFCPYHFALYHFVLEPLIVMLHCLQGWKLQLLDGIQLVLKYAVYL